MSYNKRNSNCCPLEFAKDFAASGIWEKIDAITERMRGELSWNESLTPIPIDAVLGYIEKYQGVSSLKVDKNAAQWFMRSILLHAISIWRRSKEIYEFTPELSEMIREAGFDGAAETPSEIFLRLPYPCVYIKLSDLVVNNEACDGFFAYLDSPASGDNRPTRLMIVPINRIDNTYIHVKIPALQLTSHYLRDNLAYEKEQLQRYLDMGIADNSIVETNLRHANSPDFGKGNEQLAKLLPYVLYLCAANAEITPNSEQASVMRLPKSRDEIRDKYREIRRWDVGVRIAAAYHQANAPGAAEGNNESAGGEETNGEKLHASKRPHFRRAHWHRYWQGPRTDAGVGERKLIVKWLAPMYIGRYLSDDLPVVIRRQRP
jgi:hypothetical protein